MHPASRLFVALALLTLSGCCSLGLSSDCTDKYRVRREAPMLEVGTKFLFFSEDSSSAGISREDQTGLYHKMRAALSEMAQGDQLKLVAMSDEVKTRISQLTPRDLREGDNLAELGALSNAAKAVSIRLLEWAAIEGQETVEPDKLGIRSDRHTRTDSAVYDAVVTIFDFGTGEYEEVGFGREEFSQTYTKRGKSPKSFSRKRGLEICADHLVERVTKRLSPFERASLILYRNYVLDVYLGDIEDPRSVQNLVEGIEAAKDEHWDVALECFEREWRRLEEEGASDEAKARVQWNIATANQHLLRYYEAWQAAARCAELSASKKRRGLRNDLRSKVNELGLEPAEEEGEVSAEDAAAS